MKKFWTVLLAAIIIIPLLFQSQAQAAVKFTILIDGVKLSTSQAPVMIQGRVMLPMRAIFEALDAKITWNQKAQTVTAVKDGTTIVLKINAKTATINKQTVRLDVPAKNLKGTTMVPVRFVSESLGEKVGWNSKSKTVSITTSSGGGGISTPDDSLYPVSYVTLRDVGNNGDGRDLQVNFSKSVTESRAAQYRLMIVKASKSSSFNTSAAQMVPSSNFTVAYPSGSDPSVTLTSGSRDVDGDYIRENQAYTAYILTIGKTSGEIALSSASPSLTLTNTNAVESASSVKATDINDYNDGRDLSISFTRAKNESNISNYRIIAVKTKDISRFDLAAAKAVPSQNYTTVSKTNSSSTTLSTALSSSSRDSSGEYIKNGVPYTLYVLSVSTNENTAASRLSSGSTSITLATGSTYAPVITQVSDVNDYGDGRDLRVNFTKLSDESGIGHYRIFVVKSNNYQNFNVSKANSVSSYNYTQVNKTGSNITQTLSSGARDVDGATIRSGVYYRVFVMSVGTGNNSGNNNLSSASNDIILNNNTNVGSISNLYVSDVSDYNDGRDLQVSFNRASDEYNITNYRAFVVKSNKASNFDLYAANSLSNSYYYTQINKTGYNISQILNSGSRDTDGDAIRNGVSYRVFIMSVGNTSGNNALSSYSSVITLSNNRNVSAVTNVVVNDVSDYNDGRDLKVSFTKAYDETPISQYRAFVVKSNKANNFNVNTAGLLSSYYYTQINKTGSNISQILNSGSRDTDGDAIRNDESYRVFILSVGTGNYSESNALSSPSAVITLSTSRNLNPASGVTVKDIGDNNNGSDMQVTFTRSSDYKDVEEYRIFVVKKDNAGNFKLAQANAIQDMGRYTSVSDTGSTITKVLGHAYDVDGALIKNGTPYRVFVLAVGKGNFAGKNVLSNGSSEITLTGTTKVDAVTKVTAEDDGDYGNARDLIVSFNKAADENRIAHYQVYVVKQSEAANFTPGNSNFTTVNKTRDHIRTSLSNPTDSSGAAIVNNVSYQVYVLSVSNDGIASNNAISEPSSVITLKGPSVSAPSKVTVKVSDTQDGFDISFSPSGNTENVEKYRILAVPSEETNSFELSNANDAKGYDVNPNTQYVQIKLDSHDAFGNKIVKNRDYNFYVLTINNGNGSGGNAISKSSEKIQISETAPGPNTTDPAAASEVKVEHLKDSNNLEVSFKPAADTSKFNSYEFLFLPANAADTFNLKKEIASKTIFKLNTVKPSLSDKTAKNKAVRDNADANNGKDTDMIVKHLIEIPTKDGNGEIIQAGKEYKVIIFSVVSKPNSLPEFVAVSKQSKPITLITKPVDQETPITK